MWPFIPQPTSPFLMDSYAGCTETAAPGEISSETEIKPTGTWSRQECACTIDTYAGEEIKVQHNDAIWRCYMHIIHADRTVCVHIIQADRTVYVHKIQADRTVCIYIIQTDRTVYMKDPEEAWFNYGSENFPVKILPGCGWTGEIHECPHMQGFWPLLWETLQHSVCENTAAPAIR